MKKSNHLMEMSGENVAKCLTLVRGTITANGGIGISGGRPRYKVMLSSNTDYARSISNGVRRWVATDVGPSLSRNAAQGDISKVTVIGVLYMEECVKNVRTLSTIYGRKLS